MKLRLTFTLHIPVFFQTISFITAKKDRELQSSLPEIDTPSSPFTVGATKTDSSCGMSDAQRQQLLRRDFNKIVCPFGIAVAGTSKYPDSYLLYMANVIANLIDADEDGQPDDLNTLSYLAVTSCEPPPVLAGGDNRFEEKKIDTVRPDAWGYGFSAQTWKGSNEDSVKGIMNEEIFHMLHDWGSAKAYPEALGVDDFTSSVLCREMANVVCCDPGWLHPENSCSGQVCGSVSLPLQGTCNEANCDCVEFYHQVALTLVDAQPGWYGGNMPDNKEDMEDMLSTEFLTMFRDENFHQVRSASQVNGDYEPFNTTLSTISFCDPEPSSLWQRIISFFVLFCMV